MAKNPIPKQASVLQKLQQQMNRLKAQEATLVTKKHKKETQLRRARTRTLIQLGGLITVSKLTEFANIELGDELQQDPETKEKVELLLGMLVHLVEQLPPTLTEAEKGAFIQKGQRALVMQLSQHPKYNF